jgi:thiamine biosynthesis lipoprotein
MRTACIAALSCVTILGAPPGGDRLGSLQRFEVTEIHMGVPFRLVAYGAEEGQARAALSDAFATVARIDSLMSDYRPGSEVSRLSALSGRRAARVSAETWHVLSLARAWSERTDGAFDPTVGPLTRLWRWSSRRGELPDPARLERARSAVGHRHLLLDADRRTVWLERAGMALDLGGIAKGFAADAALATLDEHGLSSALVDAGGDLALGAPPPGAEGWKVLVPGGDVLLLSRSGIATSGDRHRRLGYSHVVDARTGLGLVEAPTVVVVALDATTADVLASALSVLEADAGEAFVRSLPGVSARAWGARSWASADFPRPPSRPPLGVDR